MAASVWLKELRKALTRLPVLREVHAVTVGTKWALNFHTTPTHELCHVLEGHARIEYEKRHFNVAPGDTFIIPRHTVHRDIHAQGEDYRVLYVHFQWPGATRLLAGLSPDILLRASAGVKQHLHLMVKELETEYLSENESALQHMQVQLLEILLALARYAHRPEPNVPAPRRLLAKRQRSQLAVTTRQHLHTHLDQLITLESLAAQLRTSPFHLSRTFSQEFGVSIIEMLTTIRIERAQELLRQGQHSIKHIATQVGFGDGNYFAKVFRRRVGLSPTEFQAKAQQ